MVHNSSAQNGIKCIHRRRRKIPQKLLLVRSLLLITITFALEFVAVIFVDCHDSVQHVASLVESNLPSQERNTSSIKSKSDSSEAMTGKIQVGQDEFVFIHIVEPVVPDYVIPAMTARIGSSFSEVDKKENVALVLAEPRVACSTLINRLEVKDNIALVKQGSCPFIEKCMEVERVGGAGILIYNNDRHPDGDYIRMVGDSTGRNCSIPTANIVGKDGYLIEQMLLALNLGRAVITIPI